MLIYAPGADVQDSWSLDHHNFEDAVQTGLGQGVQRPVPVVVVVRTEVLGGGQTNTCYRVNNVHYYSLCLHSHVTPHWKVLWS